MDAADPGVDNAGSICASFDENGNHNCGDGGYDAMYIQKKGRGQITPDCQIARLVFTIFLNDSIKKKE